MALFTAAYEVELNGVGGGWTNLVSDVRRASGVAIVHGIDGSGPADLVATIGSASFVLDNSALNSAGLLGYYSLYHANKRTGWGLGINCRIRITDPVTTTVWTRFRGRIDAIVPEPGKKLGRAVSVTAVDWMDEASRWALTPDVGEQLDKRGDQILTAILAEMPRQPVATSLQEGKDRYAYALDTSRMALQPALTEFAKLAASEFGPIYLTADGTLTQDTRHTRLVNTTSVWTLTDADLVGLELPSTRDEIINTVHVTYHPKTVDDLPTTLVYTQANPIEIPAGTTKTLIGPFRDPVTGDLIGATEVQTPEALTDYRFNSLEEDSGTDLTASLTVTVTIGAAGVRFEMTNNAAVTGFLTRNQLRGRGVYDNGSLISKAHDAASVAEHGEQVVVFDMPYQDGEDVAQGTANYLLAKYKDALAQIRTIRVIGKSAALVTQILTRDISDRVTVSETVTGVANDYFINGETLEIVDGVLQASYTLASAQDPVAGAYWILGVSTLGIDTTPAPF